MMATEVIRVSAPGKVILHGEHSVVYGRRAVALSVDLRTSLSLTPGGSHLTLDLPDMNVKESWTLEEVETLWTRLGQDCQAPFTEQQTRQLRDFLGLPVDHPPGDHRGLALMSFFQLYLTILPRPATATFKLASQLPTGAGLGSSAAYAVCLAAALLRLSGKGRPASQDPDPLTLKEASDWAFRSEQIVHGTPSGIDNSICTFGGAVSFKGGHCTPVEVPPLEVLLVNTRVPRSTKALVSAVRARRDRLPQVVETILDAMDAAAERALLALDDLRRAGDDTQRDEAYMVLHELVDVNHALLASLGVSHPSLERLVSVAAAHGLHAKLTGAGGGGFGVVLLGRHANTAAVDQCRAQLHDAGYQVWHTTLGAPGVTFH